MEIVIQSFIDTIQTTTGITPVQTLEGITHGYCSKISTDRANFYFCSDLNFLYFLSRSILCESNPQEEELYDLCKEIANLVIGKAKVLYSQQNIQISIGTPSFMGENSISQNGLEGMYFAVECGKCSIYKEEL